MILDDKQIDTIKRIFDKCVEVNKKGIVEVFFNWHPHTSEVEVSIHVPNWEKDKKGKRMYFYSDSEDYDNCISLVGGYAPSEIEKELDSYI